MKVKAPPGLAPGGVPLTLDPLPLLPECAALVTELSSPRLRARYPVPAYEGASLPNLAVSAYLHGGGAPFPGMLPPLDTRYGPSPGTEGSTQVVVLVDSFGWKMFLDLERDPPGETGRKVAAGLARFTRPITSVFPPTTSSALLSLSTGTAPGTHGIVGYTEYFPGWGAILNTLRFSPPWAKGADLAAGKHFTPADWVPVPSLFTRRSGSVALTKAEFEGSAFTRVLYDGAGFVGYLGLSDLTYHLRRVLEAPDGRRPPLVWVYWDLLDSVNHVYGPEPRFAQEELTHLLLALSSVARQLPVPVRNKVQLWITGDHGQVPVRPERSRAVHEDPTLLALLDRPPSGERRAAFLKARTGRQEDLRHHLVEAYPSGWTVLDAPEVIASGLLGPGPFHPELSSRLGDLLVLPGEGETLYSRPPGDRGPEEHFLWGTHGGLTPEELLVALAGLPLSELADWPL